VIRFTFETTENDVIPSGLLIIKIPFMSLVSNPLAKTFCLEIITDRYVGKSIDVIWKETF
jgi:hypothetical protein